MRNIAIILIIVWTANIVFGQENMPIIEASSGIVDIRDGDDFRKGTWTIMPEYNPDIFYSSRLGERVVFYTDLDSISVDMTEDTEFDFIVLLNKKDTAYTQIKYKESHLKVLQKAMDYDYKQNRPIPEFTYLDSNDEHLKKIKADFNLDSIAGEGNEISQLINVMNWVHYIVEHDGNSQNPSIKNAIDLINVCQTEERGVNCRMMATILNECYLAMGKKSRMITCMPKPLEFQDCHVINAVFSTQLNKWVWLDPTFAAYVMNERGELLGLQEVRDRLIDGRPLILNPEANWNRKSSQTIDHYLYDYMAKNLYRLNCPLYSTYNAETKKEGKVLEYIELLPLDGINQEPIIDEEVVKTSKMTYKSYITNNPNQFWEVKK